MKIVKKMKLLFYYLLMLVITYLLIDMISYYVLGVEIKIKFLLFNIALLTYWTCVFCYSILNKEEKVKQTNIKNIE